LPEYRPFKAPFFPGQSAEIGAFRRLRDGPKTAPRPRSHGAKGLVLGLHAGAMMDLTAKLFLNGEVGYQLGFQKVSDVDFKTNYLQIGLGVGRRI
jgi:hypothetical protein